jgi:hypothetical protein
MRVLRFLATAAILACAPLVASAQGLIASYMTYIGHEDLYNSNGQRLSEYWQIIRQDRANYHRFGIRHRGDDWDPFFADANNRAVLEQLVRASNPDPSTQRFIVRGNVPVFVEIYGNANRITAVRVQVPG